MNVYTPVYTYTQFYDFHYKEKMNCIFTSKKKRILDCIWQEMESFFKVCSLNQGLQILISVCHSHVVSWLSIS